MVYHFFKRKEDAFIRAADYNTCLTYKAKEILLSWNHLPQPLKLAVVPCSVDLDLFDPATISASQKAAIQKELGIESNDFIVSYLGSIGGWYLTKEMMQFCKLLLNRQPAAKFLFISNNRHEVVVQEVAAYGIPADRIIVRMGKRHEVPLLLSCSHYSLFFIKPCFSKLSSSPTKHGEIMAMGIPVIANSGVGDVKEIIEKYQAGYVLNQLDEASMQTIVDDIMQHTINTTPAAIRAGAFDFYSLQKTLDTYHEVYQNVMGK
jgi:glycosyltransferase involved in cell wall biosynthesis